jgi:hypothetical protein
VKHLKTFEAYQGPIFPNSNFNQEDMDELYEIFNESHYTSITKEDIDDLEDYFLYVKDEWFMAPFKWLSHPTKAPKGFHIGDYKFYYHFYNDTIIKIGGENRDVVDFSIKTYNTISVDGLSREEYDKKLEEIKNKLLVDIDRFLDSIKHLGWEAYDWPVSRRNFIKPGNNWSNSLTIYLYK